MSYSLFKVIHLLGVCTIMTAMGGLIVLGTADEETRSRWKRLAVLTNGIGLFLAFMGGFGLLGILKISFVWPGWVFSKMLIWLILGGFVSLALRLPKWAMSLWWGSILLAGIAAYLANFKPF
jgi:hypothetical protein